MQDQQDSLTEKDIRTLNKASIADAIMAQNAEIDRPHAKLLVETFFELIVEHLERGDTVKIPGLGNVTFHPSGTLNARVTTNLIAPDDRPNTRRTRAVLKDFE